MMQPEFYTEIKFKPGYGMDPILVTPSECATIKSAQDEDEDYIDLPRLEMRLPIKAISFYTPTSKRVMTGPKALPHSTDATVLPEPVLNEQGNAQYIWGKRMVTQKEWEGTYSKRTHNYLLPGYGDAFVVAFKVIVTTAGLPADITQCDMGEIHFCEAKSGRIAASR